MKRLYYLQYVFIFTIYSLLKLVSMSYMDVLQENVIIFNLQNSIPLLYIIQINIRNSRKNLFEYLHMIRNNHTGITISRIEHEILLSFILEIDNIIHQIKKIVHFLDSSNNNFFHSELGGYYNSLQMLVVTAAECLNNSRSSKLKKEFKGTLELGEKILNDLKIYHKKFYIADLYGKIIVKFQFCITYLVAYNDNFHVSIDNHEPSVFYSALYGVYLFSKTECCFFKDFLNYEISRPSNLPDEHCSLKRYREIMNEIIDIVINIGLSHKEINFLIVNSLVHFSTNIRTILVNESFLPRLQMDFLFFLNSELIIHTLTNPGSNIPNFFAFTMEIEYPLIEEQKEVYLKEIVTFMEIYFELAGKLEKVVKEMMKSWTIPPAQALLSVPQEQ